MSIKYEVRVYPEETPVRGNAIASGDWCQVEVIAEFQIGDEKYRGFDGLSCCSYKDKVNFLSDQYFEDMKFNALQNLKKNLQEKIDAGKKAAKILKAFQKEL